MTTQTKHVGLKPFLFVSMLPSREVNGKPFQMEISHDEAILMLCTNRTGCQGENSGCDHLWAAKAVRDMENPEYEGVGRSLLGTENWINANDKKEDVEMYEEQNAQDKRVVGKIIPSLRLRDLRDLRTI